MSNLGDDHWHALERVLRLRDVVIRTGFLTLIKSTPLVGMYLHLEVAQCHGGHVNKLF